MHRFFIAPHFIQSGGVEFPAEVAHQISRVLRLKAGQRVAVLDNLGMEYLVELAEIENHRVRGRIISVSQAVLEPMVGLHMYLCLSQREKFELMLQKCTEIGASGFTPMISARTLVQEKESKAGRMERWQSILREAAEQSGRGKIPLLTTPLVFEAAVEAAIAEEGRVLLPTLDYPGRAGLRQALEGLKREDRSGVAIFIGPEGGFTRQEVDFAVASGCKPVDLGRRVLRMETAALVTSALILFELGEMG